MSAQALEGKAGRAMRPAEPVASVRVWDPVVRIFHWSLVLAFAVAWASGEEWGRVHVWAGYGVMGLIALRVAWGLVGSRHARFGDFIYRPGVVLGFVRDTLAMRARRYIGHNPAGGMMVIGMLLMLAIISATGFMMTTDAWWGIEWVEDAHELAVNVMLVLIAAHLVGVVVASLEHRENLVLAMLTGRKRAG